MHPWLLSWAMELSCNAVNRDSGMSLQNHVISSVILLYPKITWSLNIMFYNHECPSPGCIFTWNCLTMTLLYPFRCHSSATKRFAFMQAYCMGADWVEKLHWSLGWLMFRFIITLTGGEEKALCDKWSFEFSAGFEFMLPTCKEHWQNCGGELGYGSRPQVLEMIFLTNQPLLSLKCHPRKRNAIKNSWTRKTWTPWRRCKPRTLSSCKYSSKERRSTSAETGPAFIPVC